MIKGEEKSLVNSPFSHITQLVLSCRQQMKPWGLWVGTHIVPDGASIGVRNPGHLSLTRAHVWGRHVNARTWGHREKHRTSLEDKLISNTKTFVIL